ncbi:MAG: AAA family ATPase, partial [bacterium]
MSPEEVPELRIFISSPGDVAPERARALAVIARLNGEYEGRLRLHPIAWEQKTYGAHDDFQAQIEATATCDLVIGILWNRIGSALDATRYARPETGEPYESGTVFEIETALDLRRHAQLPDVALFQKNAPPLTAPSHAEAAELARNLGLMEAIRRRWQFTKTGAFKAAFNSFTDPDEFERLLEQHLRAWLAERGHGADGVVWRIRDQDGRDRTPYPGFAAYGAEHAPVFCGRDQVLELCLQDLRAAAQRGCAFLLLLGASGAGKSSLARAGLLPRLNKAGAAPGVDGWREATFRPGQDPLAALARALFAALPELAETGTPTPAVWCATVRGHAEAAANSVKAALTNAATKAATPRRLKLLLLADQLEEAFAAPAEERATFAAALAALARGGEAWVLATLRDDRYAGLLEQPLLLALKRDGATQDLIPPEGAELEAVIREPARRSRLHFERDAEGRDLADELRRVVTSADALPLLQMTLARLFEERDRDSDTMTFRAYREFGGLSGVVDTQAEDVFAKADPAAAAELPALLLGLVGGVTEEGRVLAREAPAAVLADTPAREALLALMVEGRLLLTDGREAPDGTRQIWVRVAHEALLRNWKRAQAILEPESLRAKPKVEQAQREWQAGGMRRADLLRGTALEGAQALLKAHGAALPEALRDFVTRSVAELDRERWRDLWRFRGAMAAAIVLALMAGWAGYQSIVANRQTQEAERQARIAEASRAEAEAAGEREAEAQRSLTQAANERAADAARFAEEQRARADSEARLRAETAAQRDAALLQQARATAILAEQAIDRGDAMTGMLAALAVLQERDERPWSAEAASALLRGTLMNRELLAFTGHTGGINYAAFSPDGRRLVTASRDRTALLWDLTGERPVATVLAGHTGWVNHAAFSPDGRRLVTASEDRTARLWDLTGERPVATILAGHTGSVEHAASSPDGQRLVTAGDHAARLWDLTGERPVATILEGHTDWVGQAAFSPDGRRLVTAGDRTARLWDVPQG